jgi:two-component system sensor histidine kinase AlgZ
MADPARRPWFPDFCRLPRIAAVMAIAELVVGVIWLAPDSVPRWSPAGFVASSAFAMWLGLSQAVLYCKSGPWIERLPQSLGVAAALALPLALGAFGAWAVQQIDIALGFGVTLPENQQLRFVSGVAALCMGISALALRYFYVSEQWRARVKAAAKAEVDALQARIRPHFLFNSMNTIASLVRTDPATAERAVEDLSELFRAALGAGDMDSARGESTLGEEINLGERYLAIEALRLGPRLRVAWQVDPAAPRELPLPRLVLQPLLENAVVHGIARLPAGGEIGIQVARDGDRLRIAIVNPALPPRERGGGNRHAQDSIAQRLAYHFGTGVSMSRGFEDGAYRCQITLPLP